jgi:hypothetical protein
LVAVIRRPDPGSTTPKVWNIPTGTVSNAFFSVSITEA